MGLRVIFYANLHIKSYLHNMGDCFVKFVLKKYRYKA